MSVQGILTPITNSNSDPPEKSRDQNLDEIKQKIASFRKEIEDTYLKIGHLLLKAKELFGKHGEWLKWLQENVDLSICKVQRLMRVTRWLDGNKAPVPHLTFTQAYILCKLSQKELDKFWDFINGMEKVKDMKKRELEAAVRDFLKSNDEKSSAVQPSRQAESHALDKDELLERFDQIKSEVSKLANLIDNAPDEYDIFATDLCEFCQAIIQRFSPEEMENI